MEKNSCVSGCLGYNVRSERFPASESQDETSLLFNEHRILGERKALHLPGRYRCQRVPSGDSLTPTDTSWKPPCPSLMTYNASSVHWPYTYVLFPPLLATRVKRSLRWIENSSGNRSPSTLITQLPLLLKFREAHMSAEFCARWESFHQFSRPFHSSSVKIYNEIREIIRSI